MTISLVVLKDFRGKELHLDKDKCLSFGTEGDPFTLDTLGHSSYSMQHPNGLYVALSGDKLELGTDPVPLELYADFDRFVALKLPTGAFISSHRSSSKLVASGSPLRFDRAIKLFTLIEVGIPQHVLFPWPLRCYLQTSDGLYISNCHGKLAANVESPCCSEEFILDTPSIVLDASSSSSLGQFPCHIWTADATHVASVDEHTNSIIFRSQHSCMGYESFTASLASSNKINFIQQHQATTTPALSLHNNKNNNKNNSKNNKQKHISCSWPSASCINTGKPTEFHLEIVSTKMNMLLTAHGALVRGAHRLSPAAPTLSATHPSKLSAKDFSHAAWKVEHHGDSIYSIYNGATGHSLYLGRYGMLCMDGNLAVQYPDTSTLFSIDLMTLDMPHTYSGEHIRSENAENNNNFDAEEKFIRPDGQKRKLSGFTIRTVEKVDGHHLRLCAMPDGSIITTYAKNKPSRWELFSIIDRDAVMNSPINPLERLNTVLAKSSRDKNARRNHCHDGTSDTAPSADDAPGNRTSSEDRPATLRRSNSCQAVLDAHTEYRQQSSVQASLSLPLSLPSPSQYQQHATMRSVSSVPSLPDIQEGNEDIERSMTPPPLMAHRDDLKIAASSASTLVNHEKSNLLRGRRCMSESALTDMMHGSSERKPKILADLCRPTPLLSGWGMTSAARIQDIACRSLCTALLKNTRILYCDDAVNDNDERLDQHHHHRNHPHASSSPLGAPVVALPSLARDDATTRTSGGTCNDALLIQKIDTLVLERLPGEIAAQVEQELRVLTTLGESTKLSYRQLVKGSAQDTIPVWAKGFVVDGIEDDDALPEELEESYVCTKCHGARGLLLPLDADINPRHHKFLQAMERRQFGGVRRRRGGHMPDLISLGLNVAKNGLIFLGIVRCMLSFGKKL